MVFERFTVVRVPFPFTDRNATKNRPALVLSDAASFNTPAGHSVMTMITSQGNAPWPLDCPVTDLQAAGLPAPSLVRFKIKERGQARLLRPKAITLGIRRFPVINDP